MRLSDIFLKCSFAFVVLALAACEQTDSDVTQPREEIARPAKIVPVVSGGVSVLRTFPGTLESASHVELAFRVGGELKELPAQAGLMVKKGDLLARLDDSDYRNAFNERQARFDLAKIQHDQATQLLKQKLASQLKYDQAVAELKSARSALDQARDDLQYTKLVAPFDGVVARVDIENFQSVQAKAPIIQLQDGQHMDIRFSVPESLISQLKRVDDPEEIEAICGVARFTTHPNKTFKVCHKEHESIPDPLTRNYAAVFSLEKITEFAILPGMSVSVEIDFSAFMPDDTDKGLLIPVEAVFEQDGKKWVWRVDDEMRARQVPIEIGRFKENMLVVDEGLDADDKVIAAGVSYVREAMLVKPLLKERGL